MSAKEGAGKFRDRQKWNPLKLLHDILTVG